MTRHPLLSHSIQHRFLAVALLPLLLTTMLLTLYTVEARRNDLSQNLMRLGDASSSYLATISDFSLYTRNMKLLSGTAATALQIPDVAGMAFLDGNDTLVLSTGSLSEQIPENLSERQPLQTSRFVYFKKPVYLSGVDFNDYQEELAPETSDQELVGWVILALDRTSLLKEQEGILLTSTLLFLIGMLIAAVFTYYLGLALISPIRKLTETIKLMAAGDLGVRAATGTNDELAILAAGINQLAESVAEGRETLEHRIRLATRQLQDTLENLQFKNQELELSKQAAETANQSKSDFLARMSHELRTPITSIQGFVRLLDIAKLSESDRQYCQIIDQSALQLLTLIDDILAFSKLQSNTVVLTQQPLDLAECAEQVIAMFGPQAQHKGLCLGVDYAPDLLLDRVGDTIRIQQILSNLISNAIKFTDEGGVYLTLKTDEAQAVIIEIRDTGIGIPESAQNQLFNAFAQADTSISRRFGGTGLGLSIVKSLVDLMDGDVQLHSQEGKGSTFRLRLPLSMALPIRSWQLQPFRLVISSCNEFIDKSLIHAMKRFGISDITKIPIEKVVDVSAHLSPNDRVILCVSPLFSPGVDLASLILKLRDVTVAKLVLLSTQFNFYQQFNARERAALKPVDFLAQPPSLAELHRALSEAGNDQSPVINDLDTAQVLDGINILIAEDNQFTRLLLDTLLGRLGAYCTLANNGVEALAACQQDRFDLLLIDVHMPQKNGIETLSTLRRSNNINANIPAIALTADILQQEEQSLFDAGANGLLLKPLDENQLLASICELLHLKIPSNPLPLAEVTGDISPDLFRHEVNELLQSARESLARNDLQDLRENIHQLLGIAGVFQLTELEYKVRRLHELVKRERLEDVSDLLLDLEQDTEQLEF
ncbi:MAG: ATP-binding protein [Porticoccaceae bacterium]